MRESLYASLIYFKAVYNKNEKENHSLPNF
jgi:hypothetical protein